ncbi:35724_t:CDS:2 [Gigaspora margarita]|uniref:35724_t:CDS:1 n=1 Tax=Gigaspora margarita TaxID=4874 RepID=A0ABM8VY07_GIGMA|nr:35724_t:CDS:2 [Gigaspora margarita]
MEYNLCFSDQNTNEVILTALKDLDNTFFIEHSDSEESSVSDNDNNEILDIDYNNLDRLNKFEFVEVPENYIEDKVYDDLKFGKNMRDMVIKGQLMAFQKNEDPKKVSNENKKYVHFRFCYNNSIQVCHDTYLALVGVSYKYLDTIKKHLQEHGLGERIYENTGRAPKNMKRVERDYVQASKDKYGKEKNVHVIAESTFTNHEKKLELTENYLAHLNRTQKERDYYNNNIIKAVEDGKHNQITEQVGTLYFKSPRKVHLFGVCNTGNFPHTQQTNYIIDEAEMPDDVNTIDDVVSIVNRSTTVNLNIAQRYLNGEGFHYHDFKTYFQLFKKLPNIQKYQHFYFTSQYPGVISYKDSLEDNYKTFIVRSFSFDANVLPPTINTKPLSFKRQEELYKEIAPHVDYVDLPFCDITCPKPEELKTSKLKFFFTSSEILLS